MKKLLMILCLVIGVNLAVFAELIAKPDKVNTNYWANFYTNNIEWTNAFYNDLNSITCATNGFRNPITYITLDENWEGSIHIGTNVFIVKHIYKTNITTRKIFETNVVSQISIESNK